MPPDSYEINLILKAQDGSDYALAQLLQQNYAAVNRYLLSVTFDSQTAADITQDCMVKVIDKFALYDPEKSSLSTWMITIAKNLWIEQCRKNARGRKVLEQIEQPHSDDPALEITEHDEVFSAVHKLSEKLRIPLLMKHAAGYSYEEIAKYLKIPVGTVKSRISNGIKTLRKELEGNER